MSQQTNEEQGSQVARLMARIEEEYEAAYRALNSTAMIGRHDIINHRFENVAGHIEQLRDQVGGDEAMRLAVEIMNKFQEPTPNGYTTSGDQKV